MMKKIALLCALVVSCTLFASCSGLVSLTNDGGNLVDKKNGITYAMAPICFEPISTEIEPYAECTSLNLQLYGIIGLDTDTWLSEKYDGIGGVYYNQATVTLPTLDEFEPTQIMICAEGTITTGLGSVTEQADVDAVVEAFVNGEVTALVQSGDSYKLKFSSEKYDGIYYNLIYIEGDDGENYIYDRSTKTCVNVGGVLLDYLPRESAS